jgi:hypothetical protein
MVGLGLKSLLRGLLVDPLARREHLLQVRKVQSRAFRKNYNKVGPYLRIRSSIGKE